MPGEPRDAMCGQCAALELLRDAAHHSLRELAGPVLGAWASQWMAAGLPFADLVGMVECEAQIEMRVDHARAHFARMLSELQDRYPVPTFQRTPPDRAHLSAADFPRLARRRLAGPSPDTERDFLDDQGRVRPIPRGADTLSVLLPSGDVLLIFTGSQGQTRYDLVTGAPGFQVPAELWPDVRRLLSEPS